MNFGKIQFQAQATGPDLFLTVKFNGDTIWAQPLSTTPCVIQHEFQDLDLQHVMELTLSGKQPEHTALAADGSIVSDRILEISQTQLDDIDLGLMFCNHCSYQHNFNGTGPDTEEKFYGVMGCNGTVTFRFASPIYQWLLEHL